MFSLLSNQKLNYLKIIFSFQGANLHFNEDIQFFGGPMYNGDAIHIFIRFIDA